MTSCTRLLDPCVFSSGIKVRAPKGESTQHNEDAEKEVALIERVRSGDLSSYRELVEKYQQRVHSIAFGILGNHQDAEDVVQDAFLKAYRNLGSFRGQSSFYTWLYRIVFNLSIDLSRKRYRHVESSIGDMRSLDNAAQGTSGASLTDKTTTPSAEDEYRRKELRQHLQSAIQGLSPDHRSVIMLREIDGLSYSEISDVVGCSKGTVMSRLHHARRRLQQALQDFLPEGSGTAINHNAAHHDAGQEGSHHETDRDAAQIEEYEVESENEKLRAAKASTH